jgi:hypothetical protein
MDLVYFCIVTLIGAVFCGFANRAVLNAWFQGDLFDNVRKALKTRFAAMSLTADPTSIETTPGEASDVPKPVAIPLHGWDRLASYLPKRVVQLLLCKFCLPYHTAFWLYVCGWTPAMYLGNHGHMFLAGAWLAPVVALTIVGVGQSMRKQSSDPLATHSNFDGF